MASIKRFVILFLSLLIVNIIIVGATVAEPIMVGGSEEINTSWKVEDPDIGGILVSRNIKSFHAAVNPKLIKDKENFLIKIRINFPDLPIDKIEKKLNEGKYFYIKKRLDQSDKEKLWSLGEKGLIFEPFQSRIYTHANLYSHILGQVDYDNYGVSGVEKYFDKELKNLQIMDTPLKLTLDTNIQHIIDEELNGALKTFKSTGAAALLMNIHNGEILSLSSLPNYNINITTSSFWRTKSS